MKRNRRVLVFSVVVMLFLAGVGSSAGYESISAV